MAGCAPVGWTCTIRQQLAGAVSADGGVIVGSASGTGGAFIWDPVRGMRSLQDELVNEYGLGDELEGWRLGTPVAVSPDGRTIVGFGGGPQSGWGEAWRVVLPAP